MNIIVQEFNNNSTLAWISQVQNTLGQDKVKMDYSEHDGFFFKISKKVLAGRTTWGIAYVQ